MYPHCPAVTAIIIETKAQRSLQFWKCSSVLRSLLLMLQLIRTLTAFCWSLENCCNSHSSWKLTSCSRVIPSNVLLDVTLRCCPDLDSLDVQTKATYYVGVATKGSHQLHLPQKNENTFIQVPGVTVKTCTNLHSFLVHPAMFS